MKSFDAANALAVSPDGSKVFVTGGSESRGGDRDFATLACDASSGAKLWRTRFDGPGNGDDYGDALAVSPDGSGVFVTGGTGPPHYATLGYGATSGASLWLNTYDGPGVGIDDPSALGVSPDGSMVFVTGRSGDPLSSSLYYATVAYSTR